MLDSLQHAAKALGTATKSVAAAGAIREEVVDLRGSWVNTGRQALPPAYLDDLRQATLLLRRAAASPSRAAADTLLRIVQENLDAKATLASIGGERSPKAAFKATLPVRVRTVRDGTEVPGLLVYCAPKLWAGQRQDHAVPFGRASSPTTAILWAGNYVCWSQQGADPARLGRRDVRVSDPGLVGDTVDVDVIVP